MEKRERQLLDRMMAKNFGDFVLAQGVHDENESQYQEIPAASLDETAGEILEDDNAQ